MQDLSARLRTSPDLEVLDLAHAWEISVPKPGGFLFEITVPHEALEWPAPERVQR